MSHHVHIRSAQRLIPVIQLHTRPVVICLQSLSLNQIRCDDSSGNMGFVQIPRTNSYVKLSCNFLIKTSRRCCTNSDLQYLTMEFQLCCADDADTDGLIADCYRLQSHIATTTDQHARRAMAGGFVPAFCAEQQFRNGLTISSKPNQS